MITFNTADLCDENEDIKVAEPIFKSYGKYKKFSGRIRTVVAVNDNSYVKKLLEEKVNGDVMVIDGKGSTECALLGDNLATMGKNNGWVGFVINGYIRDVDIINNIDIGIKAIGSNPKKSVKKNIGNYRAVLNFSGISFKEGQYIYSDSDGIIVSDTNLTKDTNPNHSNSMVPYITTSCIKQYE